MSGGFALPEADAADQAPSEHVDVLIVGAGLSGIGAAWHLGTRLPAQSYLILESRAVIGGTWDLFRYPGVRSDSDMYTLGYAFRPWRGARAIAEGADILRYIRDTAVEAGIGRHIRFGHHVGAVTWSSARRRWTVEARTASGALIRFTCCWLHLCSGYYDYAAAHAPEFPGESRFGGRIVHPQFWPADLDWRGKRVAVIGSGATAVTLVPALAAEAALVTMVQRSPTYVVARPRVDRLAALLGRHLPARLAYELIRWRNVLLQMAFFNLARLRPRQVAAAILKEARATLPAGYDVAAHFQPAYDPWDQRLCLAPDGDLFAAIREGRAEIVMDVIDTFTERGVRMRSGEEIDADIIVTATGLRVQLISGVEVVIDGARRQLSQSMVYKGLMFSDVPNLSFAFGYTNASWTLKADLTAHFLTRILRRMRRTGTAIAIAGRDPAVPEVPLLDFTSGYVQRAAAILPKQGSRQPWRVHQNYLLDLFAFRFGRVEDGVLHLS